MMTDHVDIPSASDGTRMGVGPADRVMTEHTADRIKIRSVSDGTRMGVGPHAN